MSLRVSLRQVLKRRMCSGCAAKLLANLTHFGTTSFSVIFMQSASRSEMAPLEHTTFSGGDQQAARHYIAGHVGARWSPPRQVQRGTIARYMSARLPPPRQVQCVPTFVEPVITLRNDHVFFKPSSNSSDLVLECMHALSVGASTHIGTGSPVCVSFLCKLCGGPVAPSA